MNEYTIIVGLGTDSVSIEASSEAEALAMVKDAYMSDYGKISHTFTYEVEGA